MRCILFMIVAMAAALHSYAQIETIVQRDGAGGCKSLSISPDGLLLARIGEGLTSSEVEIWNAKTGHLLRVIQTAKGAGSMSNILTEVRFWKGSKNIITANTQGDHYVYDVSTGSLIKKLPITSFLEGVFAVNDKMGLFVCLDPLSFSEDQLRFYDLYTNSLYDSVRLVIGAISALEFSPDGKQLAIGTKNGAFHIIDLKTFNRTSHVDEAHNEAINYVQWTKDNYLLVADEQKFTFWNLIKNSIVNVDSLGDKSRIVTSPTDDCFFKTDHEGLKRLAADGKIQRYFGIEPDNIYNVDFDKNKDRMYVLTKHFVKVWDMKNLMETQAIPTQSFFKSQDQQTLNKMMFAPNLRSAIYQQTDQLVVQGVDSSVKRSLQTPNIKSYKLVEGTLVALGDKKLIIQDEQQSREIEIAEGSQLLFAYKDNNVITATVARDSIVTLINTSNNTQKSLTLQGMISDGAISSTNKQFIVGGQRLFLVDANTLKFTELYDKAKEDFISEYGGSRVSTRVWNATKQIILSQDETRAVVLNIYGQVKCWNLVTKKIDTVINNSIDFITYSPDKKLVLASRNEMMWLDAANYKKFGNIAFLKKGDYVISVAGNYYKTSRNGAKAVAFRSGMRTASFDQFDAVFNRPDIVTKSFGNPTADMLETLQKAVAKRQKKLGVNSTLITADIEAPELTITNYNSIPSVTDKRLLQINISIADKKTPLAIFNGFINGVPLQSKNGYNLLAEGKEYKEADFNYTIALDPGRNFIEVSCTNKLGVESPRASFEIYYEDAKPEKPVLHFIGIAAGKYKDSTYNLKYPEKDITDVANLFKNKNNFFSEVKVTILKDADVTKAGILKLKDQLNATNTNDYVVVYWSGHGIVNTDLDYYLATYNINFTNPSVEGMPYPLVEDLLDSIPARKRLLLLDACHSGEIDKDDIKVVVAGKSDEGVKTYQRKGFSIGKKKVVSTASLFADLFSDVRRNSGANIISAAGAAEYALESDRWANGVFTYSFIMALAEGKADLDGNGEITISELQTYLQQKVPELTNGMQKPTSRTENLVNDWRIW